MSELALKLIAQAKETRATRLDLGNCGSIELGYYGCKRYFRMVYLCSYTEGGVNKPKQQILNHP